MNLKLRVLFFCLISFLFQPDDGFARFPVPKSTAITWILNDLMNEKTVERIVGEPKIIECKYGKAVRFNGSDDGIFLNELPLSDFEEFTIEAVFYPEKGGNFEQRFLHIGEIRGDRVLLEIRTTASDWYFDAFVKSGEQQKTLIEPKYTHPLNQWYHVALVVEKGKLSTYINGKKELEETILFNPVKSGKTSIGVRQNEQSWFNGAIYSFRISPKALTSDDFLNY